MGNTWEVYAWTYVEGSAHVYEYVLIYAGEDRDEAMLKATEAKEAGCGCVKIEWR